ncbi:hypothetical protein ABZ815_24320 [Nonomuraea sp. NPDC047529]|uniref:hypothetical protein n=1 Tax=Nonomuraea sp. NPDC047529 TaxID=3155623 RepID=UPI0034095DB9
MTMLTYTLITDPAPLAASEAGRQSKSTGTVYLLVTNTGQTAYATIKVTVPVGTGAGHLTDDFTTITPKGEHTDVKTGRTRAVTVQGQSFAFQVSDQGSAITFGPGDHMVVTLENVAVAPQAGLAVLRVTEAAGRSKSGGLRNSDTAVAVVKTAPKEIPAPHGFRADNVVVDAGTTVTLNWEGSDDFTYEILFPGGRKPVPKVEHTGSHGPYSLVLDAADAPKRDTTYTLVAGFGTRRHTVTTTVQVRDPILGTLTAVDGVTTPRLEGSTKGDGSITLLPGGVKVWSTGSSNAPGTVFADKADLNGVNTTWVQGRSTDDGWIAFSRFGLQVYTGGTGTATPGSVYADSIRAKDAPYGQGGGWINLHDEGMTVYLSKDGSNGLGSVTARDFNR